MIAFWEQIKATTNGTAGLVVFVSELVLMLLGAAVFAIATGSGAMGVAVTAGACTFIVALLAPAAAAFAQGYRPALAPGTALGSGGVLWHVTSTRWEVGDRVMFDHRRCRLRACVQRADRPFSLPRRAVYFFTADPATAHVLGNVARGRARYVYRLTNPRSDAEALARGIAVAIPGDVHAVVADRTEWHG